MIFAHLTIQNIIGFILANFVLYAYWKSSISDKVITKWGLLFHFGASLLVFLGMDEFSFYVIENYVPFLKGQEFYQFTFSALVGLFGSKVVARLLGKHFDKNAKESPIFRGIGGGLPPDDDEN